jgi:molybdate transport system regulatory protein
MKPRLNLWLENDGEVVFSIWRMRLLQAVADTGSISGAAAALDVHYRTAWQKINEMETRLGQKLVQTQVGGQRGGGATLTPLAQQSHRGLCPGQPGIGAADDGTGNGRSHPPPR